ncbi:trace amine-associated receptor 13c-like [Clarias gariepinus]
MNLTEFNESHLCEHFSCPKRSVSPALYILLYISSAAVVLLTVCGNLLVIISVFYFKQLHTPTYMLVLSLAVSDFLIGVLVMPPLFMWTIESCWIFNTGSCISLMGTSFFLLNQSVYNIALISADRYLALSNPFFYTNTITVKTMCIMIFLSWCVCLVYNILFCRFSGSFTSSVMCPGECFSVPNGVWTVIDLIFSFIFPLSVIIILYTRVFMIAKKHATAIRRINNQTQPKTQKITSHSMKSERKAAKVLCILVSVFLVCLLPYFIYSLLGDAIDLQPEISHKVLVILYLNSTLNPFIYALFYPWFRRCVKIFFTLQIFQKDSEFITVLS